MRGLEGEGHLTILAQRSRCREPGLQPLLNLPQPSQKEAEAEWRPGPGAPWRSFSRWGGGGSGGLAQEDQEDELIMAEEEHLVIHWGGGFHLAATLT